MYVSCMYGTVSECVLIPVQHNFNLTLRSSNKCKRIQSERHANTLFYIIISTGPPGQNDSGQRVFQLWINNIEILCLYVCVFHYCARVYSIKPLGLPPVLFCYFCNHQGMVLTLSKLFNHRPPNTFKFHRLQTMLLTVVVNVVSRLLLSSFVSERQTIIIVYFAKSECNNDQVFNKNFLVQKDY